MNLGDEYGDGDDGILAALLACCNPETIGWPEYTPEYPPWDLEVWVTGRCLEGGVLAAATSGTGPLSNIGTAAAPVGSDKRIPE